MNMGVLKQRASSTPSLTAHFTRSPTKTGPAPPSTMSSPSYPHLLFCTLLFSLFHGKATAETTDLIPTPEVEATPTPNGSFNSFAELLHFTNNAPPSFDDNPMDFDILLNLLTLTNQTSILHRTFPQGITILAPCDSAFITTITDITGVPPTSEAAAFETLLLFIKSRHPDPNPYLAYILAYHVIPVTFPIDTLRTLYALQPLNNILIRLNTAINAPIAILIDNEPRLPNARIIPGRIDYRTSAGVLHVIDRVLFPQPLLASTVSPLPTIAFDYAPMSPSPSNSFMTGPLPEEPEDELLASPIISEELFMSPEAWPDTSAMPPDELEETVLPSQEETIPSPESSPLSSPWIVEDSDTSINVPTTAQRSVLSRWWLPRWTKGVSRWLRSLRLEREHACFPAAATVHLANGTRIRMRDLSAGTAIQSSEGTVSAVYLFSDRRTTTSHNFVRITSRRGHSITLSRGHYLYVNGKLRVAANVRRGDKLRTMDGFVGVERVERNVRDSGLFAPHTMDGDLVVNGIVVSSYTTSLPPMLTHAVLRPVRLAVRRGWASKEPFGSLMYDGWPSVRQVLQTIVGNRRYGVSAIW